MSTRYKTWPGHLYYCTNTVVGWMDVFTRQTRVIASVARQSLCLLGLPHSFVTRNDANGTALNHVLRDLKSWTAKQILNAVDANPQESRREWLMHMFRYYGRGSANNKEMQFRQHGNHPIELRTNAVFWQKLQYLHNNPVKAGIVAEPHHYLHSSAHPDRRLDVLETV